MISKSRQRALAEAKKRKMGFLYNHAELKVAADNGNVTAQRLLANCTCKACVAKRCKQ